MPIEEMILERLHSLPPEKQQEVFNFVELLRQENAARKPLKDPEGLWQGLCADITFEEIKELRREMWGNFPREFPE